jgi:hypothetical protein
VRHLIEVSDSHPVDSHAEIPIRDLAVVNASPKPTPSKVIDTEPVRGKFLRRETLSNEKSTENPLLWLPNRTPTVNMSRMVLTEVK